MSYMLCVAYTVLDKYSIKTLLCVNLQSASFAILMMYSSSIPISYGFINAFMTKY